MNFSKLINIIFLVLLLSFNNLFADSHDKKKEEVLEKAKEIVKDMEEDEEVPLNDPFAGNEGTSSMSNIPSEEQDNEMSLYNFKLAGLISGKNYSYISLVNSGGDVITITLGQFLGKIKFVDLRLTEAIFQKDDETYMILDFNNQIREANEY